MPQIADFQDFEAARDQARRALAFPVGVSSPLWMAFGAAAGTGLAWWWASRWLKPVNLEAAEAESAPPARAASLSEPVVIISDFQLEKAEASADDLTRLVGVGPKLAAALAERGVTSFAALADWSDDQARAFDADLNLKGRVVRDAWVAQARRLAQSPAAG